MDGSMRYDSCWTGAGALRSAHTQMAAPTEAAMKAKYTGAIMTDPM